MEKYKLDVDGNNTNLMTYNSVKCFHESEVISDTWLGHVKKFVLQFARDLIEDKSMLFIVQSQMFLTYTEESRTISVIVS